MAMYIARSTKKCNLQMNWSVRCYVHYSLTFHIYEIENGTRPSLQMLMRTRGVLFNYTARFINFGEDIVSLDPLLGAIRSITNLHCNNRSIRGPPISL